MANDLKKLAARICAFGVVLFLGGCGSDTKPVEKDAAPLISGFAQIRQNILKEKCSRCHINLESYSIILDYVDPGSPSTSELYQEIVNGAMPPNGMPLSSNEIKAIETWIKGGAKND